MEPPLLSIIIPLFNSSKVISDTIKNIIDCCVDESFEILMVDDGSTDNTKEVCDDIISLYHQYEIRYIYKENGGISSSRNLGLSISRGKYVFFHDHDDRIDGNNMSIIFDILKKGNCDVFMFESTKITDGIPNSFVSINANNNTDIDPNTCIEIMFLYSFKKKKTISRIGNVWSNIYLRSFLIKNNLIFKSFIHYEDDFNFLLEIFSKRPIAKLFRVNLYFWIIRKNSTSRTTFLDSDYFSTIRKYKKYLENLLTDTGINMKIAISNWLWGYYRDFIIFYCKKKSSSSSSEFVKICRENSVRENVISTTSFRKSFSQKVLVFLFRLRLVRFIYLLVKYFY